MARRRRSRPSPGEALAAALDPMGRTGRGPYALALAVVGGLWAARLWGPALVPGWSRWSEAAVTVPLALLLVPFAGLALRRLGDAGLRGGWALLLLLPGARPALALLLALLPSSQRRRRSEGIGRALGLGLAGAAALALLASLLWAPLRVAPGGMAPTLLPGDLALLARAPVAVGRGDVVAFSVPGEAAPQVARVIALPGETVAVEGGLPVIDGRRATAAEDGFWTRTFGREGPAGAMPLCGNGTVGLGAACTTRRLVETLPGGAAHAILDAGPRPLDAAGPVTVPAGMLFVLGDHRDASADSRRAPGAQGTGLVPEAAVLGRVVRVLASSAARRAWDPRGWRPARLWEPVR